jgi:hypothetical protein
MFIADQDEQFIADAIAKYAGYIPASVYRYTAIVKDTKHLTLLLKAPDLIAQATAIFSRESYPKRKK